MQKNQDYEVAVWALHRIRTMMARTATDSTEVRIAKEVFRWTSLASGAAIVAVVVL
jgi:hypothetical protein